MSYCLTADAREIEKALSWLDKHRGRPANPLYHAPKSVGEAVYWLSEYGNEARILAGGIDVIGLMKKKLILPRALVNIKAIEEMRGIGRTGGALTMGSLTSISEIEKSALIWKQYPLLGQAAQYVGSPQIRNMATLAGNLCQEVRCWYYRRSPETGLTFRCRRKDEGGICYAVNGESGDHAVIGGGECFAVCPSDMATALLALGGEVCTFGPAGVRAIPLNRFYTPLGHVLEPNEIITGIRIPEAGSQERQRFLKLRIRKTTDFAIASVGAVLHLDEKKVVKDVRLAMGGVSYMPLRAHAAEKCLMGETLTEKLAERASELAVSEFQPLSKNAYKVQIVKTLVKRAILT